MPDIFSIPDADYLTLYTRERTYQFKNVTNIVSDRNKDTITFDYLSDSTGAKCRAFFMLRDFAGITLAHTNENSF